MSVGVPSAPMPSAATVTAFAEQAGAAGAAVHRCATVAEARAAVAGLLPSAAAVGCAIGAAVVLPDGVTPVDAAERRPHLDLGLSRAVLGVAETGSLLLAPRSRWERLLAVLARVHVVVLSEAQVCASLDDVAPVAGALDAPYLSLVTGPTRTADIERVITIGAHGPAALHVLLVAGTLPDA